MCVCVLGIVVQHSNHIFHALYYIAFWDLSDCTIFFHIISYMHDLKKKQDIDRESCVVIVCTTLVWNISYS